MSLDGFIADTNDQVGPLFDWYDNGDVEVTGSDPGLVFHTSAASADYLRAAWSTVGVDVIGRRLFDLTNGWNGRPAVGDAVFVLTHQPPTDWPYPDAPFTFVTEGLHSALAQAQALAGDRDVSIIPGNIAGQAFDRRGADRLGTGRVRRRRPICAVVVPGRIGMTEVGKQLHLEKTNLSNLMDRAEQRGLAVRTRDPNNRRITWVELTEKGTHLAMQTHAEVTARLHSLIDQLPTKDQKRLTAVVERLLTNTTP